VYATVTQDTHTHTHKHTHSSVLIICVLFSRRVHKRTKSDC